MPGSPCKNALYRRKNAQLSTAKAKEDRDEAVGRKKPFDKVVAFPCAWQLSV